MLCVYMDIIDNYSHWLKWGIPIKLIGFCDWIGVYNFEELKTYNYCQ
ncbi:hypothetical protein [Vibrio gallaecicus]|nr:hypothetical protein [Vibrio gallaecicus]MDN3616129.1 hypothetical protein [Vibrio gallaecicus]